MEQLSKYEIPIVASCLRLYLLELPDSIVSSGLYEIIKTIYSTPSTSGTDESSVDTRISVLQNTLGQLRLANIATLDAITTHFARLIDLTSADEAYITQLTQRLAPCILRSRTESSLLFEEKYNIRFLRDLLNHKEAIFTELKRNATLQHSASVARAHSTLPHGHGQSNAHPALSNINNAPLSDNGRGRAISTDESTRRAATEERNRAIAANRSRASSPAPGTRDLHLVSGNGPVQGHHGHSHARSNSQRARHRRDSSRGAETRFPVAASAGAGVGSPRTATAPSDVRNSLEVPAPTSPASAGAGAGAKDLPAVPSSSSSTTPAVSSSLANTSAYIDTDNEDTPPTTAGLNGNSHYQYQHTPAQAQASEHGADASTGEVNKSNSLGRSRVVGRKGGAGAAGSAGSRGSLGMSNRDSAGSEVGGGRTSLDAQAGSAGGYRPQGVTLQDAPMDD